MEERIMTGPMAIPIDSGTKYPSVEDERRQLQSERQEP